MHNPELQGKFREMLTAFYTVLKDADPWLRFVFITGVTKFAQMGIFSTLNQLIDISFDPQYNALCGLMFCVGTSIGNDPNTPSS